MDEQVKQAMDEATAQFLTQAQFVSTAIAKIIASEEVVAARKALTAFLGQLTLFTRYSRSWPRLPMPSASTLAGSGQRGRVIRG